MRVHDVIAARVRPWLLLAVCAAIAGWLAAPGLTKRADDQLHDLLIRLQPAREAPAGVTVIDIDERSLQEIGPWPWPRSVMAELSRALRERGATLQVWDMTFAHATPADDELAAQIDRPDTVVGVIPVLDPQVDDPPHEGVLAGNPDAPSWCTAGAPVRGFIGVAPAFAPVRTGHLVATPDADGRLRRLPAVVCDAPAADGAAVVRVPQLILAAAAAATRGAPDAGWRLSDGRWPWQPARWLERAGWRFALDADGYLPIPYQRPHSHWPAISAGRLLLADGTLPSLRGHTVLIGATALGARDVVNTPFHPNAPGVSVHAELLAAAAGGHWSSLPPRAPGLLAVLLTLLVGLVLVPLTYHGRRLVALLPALAVAVVMPLALAWLGQVLLGALLPVSAPMLALVACALALLALQLLEQRLQTSLLARHLRSFLPPRLAQQIAAQLPSGESLGQSHSGALAAVRVDGLARWVTHVDSLQALALIHALHSCTVHTAHEHGGQLEYVHGDTFYLSWNEAGAAQAALACLQQLLQRLAPILARNALEEAPLLPFAALESGSYLLGVVGAESGRRSVMLGPAANDVRGILDLGPELDSAVIIGPQAARALMSGGQPLQSLGEFLLPDQPRPRQLYRSGS